MGIEEELRFKLSVQAEQLTKAREELRKFKEEQRQAANQDKELKRLSSFYENDLARALTQAKKHIEETKNSTVLNAKQKEMAEKQYAMTVQKIHAEMHKVGIKNEKELTKITQAELDERRASTQQYGASLGSVFAGVAATWVSFIGVFNAGGEAIAARIRELQAMGNLRATAKAVTKQMQEMGIEGRVSFGQLQEASKSLSEDGLISNADAAKALANLMKSGMNVEQATETLKRHKDMAIVNRQAHYELGESLVVFTEGIKNNNSTLSDATGMTKNISVIYKEYADSIGMTVAQLDDAQKAEAVYQATISETDAYLGTAAQKAGEYEGASAAMGTAIEELKASFGALLANALAPFIMAITKVIKFVTGLPAPVKAIVIGFGVAIPVIAAVVTGLTLLSAAMGVQVTAMTAGSIATWALTTAKAALMAVMNPVGAAIAIGTIMLVAGTVATISATNATVDHTAALDSLNGTTNELIEINKILADGYEEVDGKKRKLTETDKLLLESRKKELEMQQKIAAVSLAAKYKKDTQEIEKNVKKRAELYAKAEKEMERGETYANIFGEDDHYVDKHRDKAVEAASEAEGLTTEIDQKRDQQEKEILAVADAIAYEAEQSGISAESTERLAMFKGELRERLLEEAEAQMVSNLEKEYGTELNAENADMTAALGDVNVVTANKIKLLADRFLDSNMSMEEFRKGLSDSEKAALSSIPSFDKLVGVMSALKNVQAGKDAEAKKPTRSYGGSRSSRSSGNSTARDRKRFIESVDKMDDTKEDTINKKYDKMIEQNNKYIKNKKQAAEIEEKIEAKRDEEIGKYRKQELEKEVEASRKKQQAAVDAANRAAAKRRQDQEKALSDYLAYTGKEYEAAVNAEAKRTAAILGNTELTERQRYEIRVAYARKTYEMWEANQQRQREASEKFLALIESESQAEVRQIQTQFKAAMDERFKTSEAYLKTSDEFYKNLDKNAKYFRTVMKDTGRTQEVQYEGEAVTYSEDDVKKATATFESEYERLVKKLMASTKGLSRESAKKLVEGRVDELSNAFKEGNSALLKSAKVSSAQQEYQAAQAERNKVQLGGKKAEGPMLKTEVAIKVAVKELTEQGKQALANEIAEARADFERIDQVTIALSEQREKLLSAALDRSKRKYEEVFYAQAERDLQNAKSRYDALLEQLEKENIVINTRLLESQKRKEKASAQAKTAQEDSELFRAAVSGELKEKFDEEKKARLDSLKEQYDKEIALAENDYAKKNQLAQKYQQDKRKIESEKSPLDKLKNELTEEQNRLQREFSRLNPQKEAAEREVLQKRIDLIKKRVAAIQEADNVSRASDMKAKEAAAKRYEEESQFHSRRVEEMRAETDEERKQREQIEANEEMMRRIAEKRDAELTKQRTVQHLERENVTISLMEEGYDKQLALINNEEAKQLAERRMNAASVADIERELWGKVEEIRNKNAEKIAAISAKFEESTKGVDSTSKRYQWLKARRDREIELLEEKADEEVAALEEEYKLKLEIAKNNEEQLLVVKKEYEEKRRALDEEHTYTEDISGAKRMDDGLDKQLAIETIEYEKRVNEARKRGVKDDSNEMLLIHEEYYKKRADLVNAEVVKNATTEANLMREGIAKKLRLAQIEFEQRKLALEDGSDEMLLAEKEYQEKRLEIVLQFATQIANAAFDNLSTIGGAVDGSAGNFISGIADMGKDTMNVVNAFSQGVVSGIISAVSTAVKWVTNAISTIFNYAEKNREHFEQGVKDAADAQAVQTGESDLTRSLQDLEDKEAAALEKYEAWRDDWFNRAFASEEEKAQNEAIMAQIKAGYEAQRAELERQYREDRAAKFLELTKKTAKDVLAIELENLDKAQKEALEAYEWTEEEKTRILESFAEKRRDIEEAAALAVKQAYADYIGAGNEESLDVRLAQIDAEYEELITMHEWTAEQKAAIDEAYSEKRKDAMKEEINAFIDEQYRYSDMLEQIEDERRGLDEEQLQDELTKLKARQAFDLNEDERKQLERDIKRKELELREMRGETAQAGIERAKTFAGNMLDANPELLGGLSAENIFKTLTPTLKPIIENGALPPSLSSVPSVGSTSVEDNRTYGGLTLNVTVQDATDPDKVYQAIRGRAADLIDEARTKWGA